jgi:integrase
MFLYKRKSSGVYYLHFKDENGQPRSVSTRQRKKSDALKYLRDFKDKEREKQRRVQHITLTAFVKEYLEFSKSFHRPNSHRSAISALKEFIRIVGDMPLSTITVRDVEHFIAVKREVSVHTALKHYVTVSAAMKKAVDWNFIAQNPFKRVKKPKAPDVPPLFFSKDEFIKLTEIIGSAEWIIFVTTAVMTGLRLSELVNLKWEHIDLTGRMIHVVNSSEFTTKSYKNRTVPLNDTLVHILTERKEQAASDLVFHRQGRKLEPNYVSKQFKKFVLAAGLNRRLHFHSLRHTCASWLVQAGVTIYEVQALLGHSSVSVTAKYSHLEKSQLSSAVNRLRIEGVSGIGSAA